MITTIARKCFSERIKTINSFSDNADHIQKTQLVNLLKESRHTEFGKQFNFNEIKSPQQFSERVPVQTYDQIRSYVDRMIKGEKDVLWRGRIKCFAQSSGTTDSKSKFIPVSDDSFRTMHFKGGSDTVAMYLNLNPTSQFFSGKSLTLGAGHSYVNNYGSHLGLLSGLLNERMMPLAKVLRQPRHSICMIPDFTEKMERMIPEIIKKDIVSFSGIPSWFQILFARILEVTGEKNLSAIWPNMEVFIHGGVSFDPYREMFRSMIGNDKMNFFEVYNASEGFFSMQNDFNDPAMLLMLDYGTYYEFQSLDDGDNSRVIPLWEVELGKSYAMILSNNSGLWRYNIGDVVTFTSVKPYKFVISGRTKHFLNLCGEELMVGNSDAAIARASELCNVHVLNYTATVVLPTNDKRARHQWLIEFVTPPSDPDYFSRILDESLCEQNSDYESKRARNVALDAPSVHVARSGLFVDWLKKHNKDGGQQKIPRLSEKREFMDELLSMNQ